MQEKCFLHPQSCSLSDTFGSIAEAGSAIHHLSSGCDDVVCSGGWFSVHGLLGAPQGHLHLGLMFTHILAG